MARTDPSKMAEKFRRRVAAAGTDYADGVSSPRRGWLEGYRSAADRMQAELQRALAEGRHVKGAQAAGDAKWQTRAVNLGARRYQEAASVAAEAYSQVAGDIAAAAEAASRAASALPDTSLEERLQRATAAMRAIHEHWARKR